MAAYPGSNFISTDETVQNIPFLIAFVDSHDETDDEHEEEIEVEIENEYAKIEVEINDEESKYEIEWINEQTTIDEILALTGLSEDQVTSVIIFEIESEEDHPRHKLALKTESYLIILAMI